MTISELIEQLEELQDRHGEDAEVYFASDYGDIGHTTQALEVGAVGEADASDLRDSGYSRSGVAFKESEDYDYEYTEDPDECDKVAAERDEPIIVLASSEADLPNRY